jgi:hypothetical protein
VSKPSSGVVGAWGAGAGSGLATGGETAAILDRLVHNAYRLELKGKSMRGNGARREVADPAVDEIVEQSK